MNVVNVSEVGPVCAPWLWVDDVLRMLEANAEKDVAVGRGTNVLRAPEGVYSHLKNTRC